MDMTQSIEPKSDQINADDLLAGSRTFTIEKVTGGSAEQPVNVHLEESPGKPYRPSKSMRRVLVAAWGAHSDAYIGQKLTLYRDPAIKFGGIAVGGIVISHMSGIEKPLKVSLTVTKGKKTLTTIQPLQGQPAAESQPQPAQPDPIEQSLNDAWDDYERLQKAVQWLREKGHPLHKRAVDRLSQLDSERNAAERPDEENEVQS